MANEALAALRELAGIEAIGQPPVQPVEEMPDGAEPTPRTQIPSRRDRLPNLQQLREDLQEALVAAQTESLPRHRLRIAIESLAQLQNLATRAAGLRLLAEGLARQISAGDEVSPEARTEFDALRGRLSSFLEVQSILDRQAAGVERDALDPGDGGTRGRPAGHPSNGSTHNKRSRARTNRRPVSTANCHCCSGRTTINCSAGNPIICDSTFEDSQLSKVRRTLMVARLEAPTLVLTKGLIDTAIRVEEEGLKGKVYLDARGIGKLDEAERAAR